MDNKDISLYDAEKRMIAAKEEYRKALLDYEICKISRRVNKLNIAILNGDTVLVNWRGIQYSKVVRVEMPDVFKFKGDFEMDYSVKCIYIDEKDNTEKSKNVDVHRIHIEK